MAIGAEAEAGVVVEVPDTLVELGGMLDSLHQWPGPTQVDVGGNSL